MKYPPIDKRLFIKNRKDFINKMKPNSVAIFLSNDIMPTNADGTMPFVQNTNLLYLSGIDQEDSILIIAPDFDDEKYKEILFMKETNKLISIWEGNKLTKQECTDLSGIKTVYWNNKFDNILEKILSKSSNIYLEKNEHPRSANRVETNQEKFFKYCSKKYKNHKFLKSYPILSDQRMIKSQIEIDLISKACKITEKGFKRILNFIKPDVWEYEIEAEYIHEFIKNKSKGFAYEPIIAGGINACCLHYNTNNSICKNNEMILMDVAAEFANYKSDMTRTIPINGKFSSRQLKIYNAVLNVKNEATKILRPGISINQFHIEVQKIMESELINIGLLNKNEVQKQDKKAPLSLEYFMHGTSHHLGLDVHDVGNFDCEIEVGNVFTVEPGIYIKEESLGIRLEDNILIGEKENINLMNDIPILPEEIEELMNQKR